MSKKKVKAVSYIEVLKKREKGLPDDLDKEIMKRAKELEKSRTPQEIAASERHRKKMDKEFQKEIDDFRVEEPIERYVDDNERKARLKIGLRPELIKIMKRTPGYEKGDEDSPFFSEAMLYVLFGKEQARDILGFVEKALRDERKNFFFVMKYHLDKLQKAFTRLLEIKAPKALLEFYPPAIITLNSLIDEMLLFGIEEAVWERRRREKKLR